MAWWLTTWREARRQGEFACAHCAAAQTCKQAATSILAFDLTAVTLRVDFAWWLHTTGMVAAAQVVGTADICASS